MGAAFACVVLPVVSAHSSLVFVDGLRWLMGHTDASHGQGATTRECDPEQLLHETRQVGGAKGHELYVFLVVFSDGSPPDPLEN